MGRVLLGIVRTTEVVRRAIQHIEESLRALARRYRVKPKTIAKCKNRRSMAGLPAGLKDPRLNSLSIEESDAH